MKKIHQSGQYKKDLKRYSNKPETLKILLDILRKLANEEPIPKDYNPHTLVGDYKGFWECHIQNDVLLIWIDSERIELVRLGSHSELYGKGRKR